MSVSDSPPEALLTCAECGCVSDLIEAFRWQHRSGVKRQPHCPACVESDARRTSTSFLIGVGVAFILGLMVPNPIVQIPLLAGSIGMILSVLLTPWHEMSHAGMAWLLGVPVYRVQMGMHGRLLYQFRWGRCIWVIRFPLFGGYVSAAPLSARWCRVRMIAVTLAGPAMDIALLLSICVLVGSQKLESGLMVFSLLVCLFIEVGQNVIPRTFATTSGMIANDALLVFRTFWMSRANVHESIRGSTVYEAYSLLERHDFDRACLYCRESLRGDENDLYLRYVQACCELELGQLIAADETARNVLAQLESPHALKAGLHFVLAAVSLKSGDPAALPQAFLEAERAYRSVPWSPEVRYLRGSVFVETGRLDEGIDILQRTLRESESRAIQGWSAAYLALAYLQQGAIDQARAMRAKAAKLVPSCWLLPRLDALLNDA